MCTITQVLFWFPHPRWLGNLVPSPRGPHSVYRNSLKVFSTPATIGWKPAGTRGRSGTLYRQHQLIIDFWCTTLELREPWTIQALVEEVRWLKTFRQTMKSYPKSEWHWTNEERNGMVRGSNKHFLAWANLGCCRCTSRVGIWSDCCCCLPSSSSLLNLHPQLRVRVKARDGRVYLCYQNFSDTGFDFFLTSVLIFADIYMNTRKM